MQRPNPTAGLRHIALFVNQFEACVQFYQELVGMQRDWQPDSDNAYFSSGNDILALHKTNAHFQADKQQRLDHIGFILNTSEDVTAWYSFLEANGVKMKTAPRQHRDGSESFYCFDPDGNTVQFIYYPLFRK